MTLCVCFHRTKNVKVKFLKSVNFASYFTLRSKFWLYLPHAIIIYVGARTYLFPFFGFYNKQNKTNAIDEVEVNKSKTNTWNWNVYRAWLSITKYILLLRIYSPILVNPSMLRTEDIMDMLCMFHHGSFWGCNFLLFRSCSKRFLFIHLSKRFMFILNTKLIYFSNIG